MFTINNDLNSSHLKWLTSVNFCFVIQNNVKLNAISMVYVSCTNILPNQLLLKMNWNQILCIKIFIMIINTMFSKIGKMPSNKRDLFDCHRMCWMLNEVFRIVSEWLGPIAATAAARYKCSFLLKFSHSLFNAISENENIIWLTMRSIFHIWFSHTLAHSMGLTAFCFEYIKRLPNDSHSDNLVELIPN